MYTTAKRLATISAIACAIIILGLFLFILCSGTLSLTFAMAFAVYAVLIGGACSTLFLTLSLRSICQDLEYEYENTLTRLKELSDRLNVLESKENN